MPPSSELFDVRAMETLYPLYIGIAASLEAITGLITPLQPHGAIAALYLPELPFYARDNGPAVQKGRSFPLTEISCKMARNPTLAKTLVDVACC